MAPVERKVQASTAAAAVSGLALWVLGRYIFKGSVPDVVASWVYVLVPSVVTFMAGYAAKHTDRPLLLPGIATLGIPSTMPQAAPPEKTLIQPPAAPE